VSFYEVGFYAIMNV